jgi:hypothetical protein
MNFQVMSKVLARYAHQFDTVLKIYDSAGNLIAFNDDEFESQDSIITDLKLPADGLYYAVVDSFTPDGVNDFQTGSYELYMYSFAAVGSSVTSPSSGSTLVAGSGNDVLIGSTGNDVFTFLPGSTGNATVVGGNGAGPDLGLAEHDPDHRRGRRFTSLAGQRQSDRDGRRPVALHRDRHRCRSQRPHRLQSGRAHQRLGRHHRSDNRRCQLGGGRRRILHHSSHRH